MCETSHRFMQQHRSNQYRHQSGVPAEDSVGSLCKLSSEIHLLCALTYQPGRVCPNGISCLLHNKCKKYRIIIHSVYFSYSPDFQLVQLHFYLFSYYIKHHASKLVIKLYSILVYIHQSDSRTLNKTKNRII